MNKSRERMKGFIIGFVVAMVLSSSVMALAGTGVMREIFFGVNVTVHGEPLKLDEDMQPFIMGGRTFLPAMIVEQIVDMPVNWDGETQTVHIGREPIIENMLLGAWRMVSAKEIFIDFDEEYDDDIFLVFAADGTLVIAEEGRPVEIENWTFRNGQLHIADNEDDVIIDVEMTETTLTLSFDDWGTTVILILERLE